MTETSPATKTGRSRVRLSPEQIAAREAHTRAERQLDEARPQTVPAGTGIEPPSGDNPTHPPTRAGRDTHSKKAAAAPVELTFTSSETPAPATAPLPTSATATFAFIAPNSTADPESRHGALMAINPDGPARDVAAVKDDVIALIEAIPYKGYETDRSLMTIGAAFARWCLHNTADGEFVPSRDLNEDSFDDFLTFDKGDVSEATRGTYTSQLRRLARQGRPRRKGVKKPPAPPYNAKVRDRLWRDACDMTYWGAAEMLTLLALTFGAGCRGAEVHTTTADHVDRVKGRVALNIVRDHTWVREVPVYGHYGQWLAERARGLEPDQWLFRPTVTARRNATSDLVMRMRARNEVFTGFKSTRARHTWLATCLQAGIPFPQVCDAAGLARDSNLPTDLLPHMPHPTTQQTRRAFDAAFARNEMAA